jgi:hypothetical protein
MASASANTDAAAGAGAAGDYDPLALLKQELADDNPEVVIAAAQRISLIGARTSSLRARVPLRPVSRRGACVLLRRAQRWESARRERAMNFSPSCKVRPCALVPLDVAHSRAPPAYVELDNEEALVAVGQQLGVCARVRHRAAVAAPAHGMCSMWAARSKSKAFCRCWSSWRRLTRQWSAMRYVPVGAWPASPLTFLQAVRSLQTVVPRLPPAVAADKVVGMIKRTHSTCAFAQR